MIGNGALLDDLALFVEDTDGVGLVSEVNTDGDAWNFVFHDLSEGRGRDGCDQFFGSIVIGKWEEGSGMREVAYSTQKQALNALVFLAILSGVCPVRLNTEIFPV